MLNKLLLYGMSLISETEEVWCVGCRAHRKVVVSDRVIRETKKGIIEQLKGRCTTCTHKTSTIRATGTAPVKA